MNVAERIIAARNSSATNSADMPPAQRLFALPH